jgi:hypothetical protein
VDGGAHHRPRIRITGLRSLAYTKGITIPASRLGKIKMAIAGDGHPSAHPGMAADAVAWRRLAMRRSWVVMLTAVILGGRLYRRFVLLIERACHRREH